jgi:hypothetical protein
VQVKRRTDRIGAGELRSFMAVLGSQDVGIFVAAGGFTPDAEAEARSQEPRGDHPYRPRASVRALGASLPAVVRAGSATPAPSPRALPRAALTHTTGLAVGTYLAFDPLGLQATFRRETIWRMRGS